MSPRERESGKAGTDRANGGIINLVINSALAILFARCPSSADFTPNRAECLTFQHFRFNVRSAQRAHVFADPRASANVR